MDVRYKILLLFYKEKLSLSYLTKIIKNLLLHFIKIKRVTSFMMRLRDRYKTFRILAGTTLKKENV
ncbi:MAG: hypothetical protein ACI9JT_000671 [Polaribacter sp.]|jgi:hypothetical protein